MVDWRRSSPAAQRRAAASKVKTRVDVCRRFSKVGLLAQDGCSWPHTAHGAGSGSRTHPLPRGASHRPDGSQSPLSFRRVRDHTKNSAAHAAAVGSSSTAAQRAALSSQPHQLSRACHGRGVCVGRGVWHRPLPPSLSADIYDRGQRAENA